MHIHSVRETGRKRRERGEKYRKNKGNGKYSKAHAWVLTKCKWKRKAPHQHIAIKGSSQITCELFSKTVFLLFSLCPFPCFSFQLFLSFTPLSVFWFLTRSPTSFGPVFVLRCRCWKHWKALSYHKGETVRRCDRPEGDRKGATFCVSVLSRYYAPLLSGSSLFSKMSLASVPSSIRSSLVITPMVLKPDPVTQIYQQYFIMCICIKITRMIQRAIINETSFQRLIKLLLASLHVCKLTLRVDLFGNL